MKRALRILAVMVVFGLVVDRGTAAAAPEPRATVTGTSPQIYDAGTFAFNSRIIAQCPAQVVSFRPMNDTEVHDGGVRDLRMDFIANPDAYPIPLTPPQTRIYLKNIDGGALDCNLYNNL